MRIASIAVRIPSRKITNEDMLAEIARLNPDSSPKQLNRYLRDLGFILHRCGFNTRFLRDRESGETAHALIHEACTEALASAGIAAENIGLLIYCGVGRGFFSSLPALTSSHDHWDLPANASTFWTPA
jgi:3-oxoacyl-[acyl-carrier-protein] synthase III